MNLSIGRFGEFFSALYQDKQTGEPIRPFPWQVRLAEQVNEHGWPECIDLPTASGKTACIDIAVFVLACQARRHTSERAVGRRVFFAVNRRVIVDEAFDRARSLAQKLLDAKEGILKEVADALREISGDAKNPPLDVAQLRGGIYRDRAWARSITQPIVVCTTADQLGSRLLFRGYGVSSSMQPVHAALTACDSLILLDEAHVTRAFCQTMQLLTKYQKVRTDAAGGGAIPPMRLVQMTATPTGGISEATRFSLKGENWDDPNNEELRKRRDASKPARLVKADRKSKSIADTIIELATPSAKVDALIKEAGVLKAVGIIVNRVQTARTIYEQLAEQHGAESVHLIIGRMRPIDRDDLQLKLRNLVGPGRPDVLPADAKPVFVVATQCLEVGADYDFDALITECASIDALRQRFGRLNRRGRSIRAAAAIVTSEDSIKGGDPIYGDAIKHTWEWLWSNKDGNNQVNFGIADFKPLWEEVEAERGTHLDENCSKPLLSPTQNAAVLLPAHLDAFCQTNPQPVPSPDVSYFIHGPQRDMAEVNVCWRADLGADDEIADRRWPEIVRLLPPTSPECMTVPLWEVRRWMQSMPTKKEDRDADIPVASDADESKPDQRTERPVRRVVVWRGSKDCCIVESPNDLRPGDTVVIRAEDLIADIECEPKNRPLPLGHIPNLPTWESLKRGDAENSEGYKLRRLKAHADLDLAEQAVRESRRRVVVRLHTAFPEYAGLRGFRAEPLRKELEGVFTARFEAGDKAKQPELSRILPVLSSSFEPHLYPDADNDSADRADAKPSRVIVFKRLLDAPNGLIVPSDDEDDGDDTLSERDQLLSLEAHTRHVVERTDAALGRLGVNRLESTLRKSARFHDLGKADVRFQAMLAGVTPYEAMMRSILLGKGGTKRPATAEIRAVRSRATFPEGFRHEMLSVEIVRDRYDYLVKDADVDSDLLLHLIAAHHGYARPFAPVVMDDAADGDVLSIGIDEMPSIEVGAITVTPDQRKAEEWIPCHRLDSGVAERFWTLTRKHGWWGLAWLESILRLADQQASAAEQEPPSNQEKEAP